jgi:hypothetical protein
VLAGVSMFLSLKTEDLNGLQMLSKS